jgi:predicted CoA-binding protein
MITKKSIDDFYSKKRIAVIGASRDKAKYGHMLLSELLRNGYDAVPVNPNAGEILGRKCYASVRDVSPKAEAAFAVVKPELLETIVSEVAAAGIKDLWMHEHVMKGVSNPAAIALAQNKGINTILGFCPMMFMPGTAVFHRIHGLVMRLFGAYPK